MLTWDSSLEHWNKKFPLLTNISEVVMVDKAIVDEAMVQEAIVEEVESVCWSFSSYDCLNASNSSFSFIFVIFSSSYLFWTNVYVKVWRYFLFIY